KRVQIQCVIQRSRLQYDSVTSLYRQCCKRYDIVNVMSEDRLQRRCRPVLEVIEVGTRNHGAGNIGTSQERQDLTFQRHQPATAGNVSAEFSGREEQIEVGHRCKRTVKTRKSKPCIQQRDIKSEAIVCDD